MTAAMFRASSLTVKEAAALLGVSRQRVQWFVSHNRLKAQKHGRDWLIKRADLDKMKRSPNGVPLKSRRKAGRK